MVALVGETAGTLGERLAAGRRRRFVGRAAEAELFRQALTSPGAPVAVWYVHGPGGIGKTALLDVFADLAADEGLPVVRLDGRDLQPTPTAVLRAVSAAVGLGEINDADAALARLERTVLLVDTYERLAPADPWVRSYLLPSLPATTVTVLAGREPPPAAWRADPGWRGVLGMIALRNLAPKDSRDYLHACQVDTRLHDRIIELTHGHPLGLSLVADVVARGEETLVDPMTPDVLGTLLRRFVEVVPSELHRRALEVGALARVTTEPLLRMALGVTDAHDLFEWLRGLSFIESGPHGLFPHDLARDALDADLHWRDPEAYQRLFRGIRAHIIDRLTCTTGQEQQRVLFDAKFMHRHQPVSRVWADWDTFGQHYPEAATPDDVPVIVDLVATWEGEASAGLVRRWWARQPAGFFVVRHHDGQVRGCIVQIDLTRASAEDIAADPGAAAALAHARRQGPLRPGDIVSQLRFCIDRESYQQPSPTLNLGPVLAIQHYLNTPRLAADYLTFAEPERWEEYFAFFDIPRAVGADFTVGGRTYGLFARDFRRIPLDDWLLLMFERDLTGEHAPPPRAEESPVLALSEPEFEQAVRQALRDLRHRDRLAANPLARSRLVLSLASGRSSADALGALVRETVDGLRADRREEKFFHALDRTYVRPAATQEHAAEVLDLPLSTYKRHLKRGVERVVAELWHQELSAGA